MNYIFTEKQVNEIIENWSNDFYLKIQKNIEMYSHKWKLSDFNFVEYYSVNAIFFCKSDLHGDCVLKISRADIDEVLSEYNALREYNGRRFIKAFEYDNNAILVERVIPGKMLRDEPFLEKRLAVFSKLFNGLQIEPKNPEIYDSYVNWVCDITDYISRREDCKELYAHMAKAKELCLEIVKTYDKKLLLHGDFHYENIISCGNGKYKIIDPKEVIGDPVFDVGRYILNEYGDDRVENRVDSIEKVVEYFEKSLNIPDKILRQGFYIEITMAKCWSIEDGETVDIDDMNYIKFAEKFMNGVQ